MNQFNKALQKASQNPKAVLVLAASWSDQLRFASVKSDTSGEFERVDDNQKGYNAVLTKIKKLQTMIDKSHKLIVFGAVPGAKNMKAPLDALLRPDYFSSVSQNVSSFPSKEGYGFEINKFFAAHLPELAGLYYLSPYDALCQNDNCYSLIDDKIIYSDGLHLSLDGSVLVIQYFEKKILEILQ